MKNGVLANLVGEHLGAIVDQDGQLVTKENPVAPGEWITIYATGLGAVTNPVKTGHPATADGVTISRAILPISANLSLMPCEIYFAGLAPGFVGLYQINARIPVNPPKILAETHTFSVCVDGVYSRVCSNSVNLSVSR